MRIFLFFFDQYKKNSSYQLILMIKFCSQKAAEMEDGQKVELGKHES
jgi:hypothetical protein